MEPLASDKLLKNNNLEAPKRLGAFFMHKNKA
jgi:hypothetical protein